MTYQVFNCIEKRWWPERSLKEYMASQDIISEREQKRDRERPTEILTNDVISPELHRGAVVSWKEYVAAQDLDNVLTRRTINDQIR